MNIKDQIGSKLLSVAIQQTINAGRLGSYNVGLATAVENFEDKEEDQDERS